MNKTEVPNQKKVKDENKKLKIALRKTMKELDTLSYYDQLRLVEMLKQYVR